MRKDQYRQEPKISFQQVYFKDNKLDQLSPNELQQLIDALDQSPEAYLQFGDAIMLQPMYTQKTPTQVGSQFGTGFSEQLFTLDNSDWSGPITSGFGSHLVRILDKKRWGRSPFGKVWDQVVNDLIYEEKQAAKEQFYTELFADNMTSVIRAWQSNWSIKSTMNFDLLRSYLLSILVCVLFAYNQAHADIVSPTRLEIKEIAPGVFEVFFVQPVIQGRVLKAQPVLPGICNWDQRSANLRRLQPEDFSMAGFLPDGFPGW